MTDDLFPDDAAVPETEADLQPEGEAQVIVERAKLTLKRGGVLTDIAFEFAAPAVVGRFDPAVGPVDIDLGSIEESAYISRKHARIACDGGTWTVSDLGSSNGVYVMRDDFERVEEAELADGAVIALGNAHFVFSIL